MKTAIAIQIAAFSAIALPMLVMGTNLYYPSPNTQSCDCPNAEENEDAENDECLCYEQRIRFPSQEPDRFAEEQHNEVGWPARRDELSDDLSR